MTALKPLRNKIEFIRRSNIVHKFKYDYSLVEYKGSKIKVSIICKEHGIFQQIPSNHLYGFGCRKCGIVITTAFRVSNTKEFIEKSIKIHGDK